MGSVYQDAIDVWGVQSQCLMAMEECAELIQALSHYRRYSTVHEVVEEIADVEIMCKQLRLMFDSNEIDKIKKEKLKRLRGLITAC